MFVFCEAVPATRCTNYYINCQASIFSNDFNLDRSSAEAEQFGNLKNWQLWSILVGMETSTF